MRAYSLLFSAVLVGAILGGCSVDESPSLILHSFHGLSADEGGCVHTERPISTGLLDVEIAEELDMPLLVYFRMENVLSSNEGMPVGQLNSRRIEVHTIHVSFVDNAGTWGNLPEPIQVPVSGVLIDTGGEYFAPIPVLPGNVSGELLAALPDDSRAKLGLRMHVEGTTLDGVDVVSNQLTYGLDVCAGCLPSMCPGGMLVPLCRFSSAQGDGVECVGLGD